MDSNSHKSDCHEYIGGAALAAELPPKTLKRWVAGRKAAIIAAVAGGLLTEFEARARYNISREEFSAWLRAYYRDGVPGLRVKAGAKMRPRNQP
jgi:hypothetical protein